MTIHLNSFLGSGLLGGLLLPGISAYAQPQTANVVPGKSLGRVSLGMSPGQVHKLLGKPDKTLRLSNGLLDDLYKAKTTRVRVTRGYSETVRDTVEILYKSNQAVQLEATSPVFRTRSGLSTLSPLRDLDRVVNPKRYSTYGYERLDAVKYYLDGVQLGLCFESTPHQENWFFDTPAHAIIVHRKGVPVIPDQGGEFQSTVAQVPPEDG